MSDKPDSPKIQQASATEVDPDTKTDDVQAIQEAPKFNIMIYHFDAKRDGFEAGRSLQFDSNAVKNIYNFQRAVIDTTRTRYSMVKVVMATETENSREYEVADDADFTKYFRQAVKNPEANVSRQMIGVIHKAGEGTKFLDTVDSRGFPLL